MWINIWFGSRNTDSVQLWPWPWPGDPELWSRHIDSTWWIHLLSRWLGTLTLVPKYDTTRIYSREISKSLRACKTLTSNISTCWILSLHSKRQDLSGRTRCRTWIVHFLSAVTLTKESCILNATHRFHLVNVSAKLFEDTSDAVLKSLSWHKLGFFSYLP